MPHRDSDSDTASSSRRKRKKRTHARSGSSSSDNSSDRYRRKKKSGHSSHDKSRRRRSRSNSSSRYSSTKGSSSRRRRSGSRHRRSRSWSPGPRRRSRTPKHRSRRSRSSSSSRRRSWSGSDSPRRSRKASASISPKRVRRPGDPLPPKTGKETDQLKQKIQQVIKKSFSVTIEAASNVTPQTQAIKLIQSSTITEQMAQFYEMEKLSDLETRLGFVVCRQVEEFISGLYPKGQVLPFGSLVNGFGRHNCDIDMVYCVPEARVSREPSGQLYFQDKNQAISDRTLVQRILETLGDLLHYVVPGVSEVQRILRARVPIVKFQHNVVGRECDLTLNNMSGVHMSRLLHSCTQLAPALCPLLFTVRSWATAQGVTTKVPGTWITNFQLTLLAIFHLQQCGLLPSLRDLEDKKRLKTWQKSRLSDEKSETFEDILRSFFEYYASFNFKSKGIAPFSGQTLEKPEYTAMFVQNPLDRQLNASRNVGLSDLKKLQGRMAEALSLIDNAPRKITVEKPWGIMALFTAQTAAARKQQEALHRRFQVHELFQENKEAGENYVIEATVAGVKTAS